MKHGLPRPPLCLPEIFQPTGIFQSKPNDSQTRTHGSSCIALLGKSTENVMRSQGLPFRIECPEAPTLETLSPKPQNPNPKQSPHPKPQALDPQSAVFAAGKMPPRLRLLLELRQLEVPLMPQEQSKKDVCFFNIEGKPSSGVLIIRILVRVWIRDSFPLGTPRNVMLAVDCAIVVYHVMLYYAM